MPDLAHLLQDRDYGFLRIIAERWGVELTGVDARSALPALISALTSPENLESLLEVLPPDAHTALHALQRAGGRLPWSEFTRVYGTVRGMGPGRRDRERPDRHPACPTEALYYRALLSRGFFDTPSGPQEFACIPDDLLARLPPVALDEAGPAGEPAPRDLVIHVSPADDAFLDQACTFLAARRVGLPDPAGSAPLQQVLAALLQTAGLLDRSGQPALEAARLFLEAPRGAALLQLFQAWLGSTSFNELHLHPDLVCEGEWRNDPLAAREAVVAWLRRTPAGTWWSLEGFIRGLRERQPDFQRTAGEYDSWFIRSRVSGQYLRGFERWMDVEGALLRFFLTGPLHWLGVVDLAAPGGEEPPAAFRLSTRAAALFKGLPPQGVAEDVLFQILSDGRMRVPARVLRSVRYQVARFCAWEPESHGEYLYRITPSSLERARRQGLRLTHLLALLRRAAAAPPAPTLVRALERWEESGTQASFEPAVILRVKSPEILTALRASRAARFLGDPLGPTAVIVKSGTSTRLVQALLELGYLADASLDDPERV